MSQDNIEMLARKWLRDNDTPSEELNLAEALRRAQAYTDGETLAQPLSLAEVVAMVMKVIDVYGQYLLAMNLQALARVEGWHDDEARMAQELESGWASMDLLRVEAVIDVLEQRAPRAPRNDLDEGNQSPSQEG